MRSRFLIELTTPDVEEYFAQGGKTAFLPVGSVEMHGPHQPLGTDTLIAKACALRLAESADGIVLPEIPYTWAGATDGFAGTISVEPDLQMNLVCAIAPKVQKMGFKRLIILSVHAPNRHSMFLCVRRIFEQHRFPAVFLNPCAPFGDSMKEVFAGNYAKSIEASLVLAALHILGKPDVYSEKQMSYEEQAPPLPESLRGVRPGVVGYYYQDPRQHACPSPYVSLEKGLEYIDKQVAHILPILDNLDRYIEDIKTQENKGWW